MFDPSLHGRIAKALGWSLSEVRSMALAALREFVRPKDPALAAEIGDTLTRGAHVTRGPRRRRGDTHGTSKPVRYIAKCRTCGCVTSALTEGNHCHRKQNDPAREGGVFTFTPANGQPLPWPATAGGFAIACRKCGQPRNAIMVRGKFSAKHKCNDKCMSSTGTVCECSCGGKNHGGAYSAA